LDAPYVHPFVSQYYFYCSKLSAQLTQVKRTWVICASLTAVCPAHTCWCAGARLDGDDEVKG
jgi:hypothetical protein